MINFKQTNHSSRIARAVGETENDENLVISGSDGVPININNLWLFSPLVRSILDSLTKAKQHLILMPGLSSDDIRNGLAILNGPDPDSELIFFNKKAKDVLETLGIDIGNSELIEPTDGNLKIDKKVAIRNSGEVNCVYCQRKFVGCRSKLKDKLKCHIGNIHFSQEMEEEISVFFNTDHKCKECGKYYHQESMKRKHLTFNHSYLVEQIMAQVYESLDMESGKHPTTQPINELPDGEENKSLDDTQNMLNDQNFRKEEITKLFIDENDDIQNQLMLIQNLSDSEDEDDVPISDDWGILLISQNSQESTDESLLVDDNFSYDEGEDTEKDDYDISSDEDN